MERFDGLIGLSLACSLRVLRATVVRYAPRIGSGFGDIRLGLIKYVGHVREVHAARP